MIRRTKKWCSFILSLSLSFSGFAAANPSISALASQDIPSQQSENATQNDAAQDGAKDGSDAEEASNPTAEEQAPSGETPEVSAPETSHAASEDALILQQDSAEQEESQADLQADAPEEQAADTVYAKSVNFTKVKINDAFWGSRQKQFICKVIPTAIANVESRTGGIPNIKNTALMHRGEEHGNFNGAFYVDSDVHKVLESMCYALMIDPQGDAETIAGQDKIKSKLEEWIPYYVDAQEENGYFDTYFTLASYGGATKEKFSDFNLHELYCAGHFYEAAVAHYNATGGQDTRLLDMAVKNADYMASLFGVGKWKQVPGHQEIELALIKLADLCEEIGGEYAKKAPAYTELAKFFLDTRGDYADRHGSNHNSFYDQDHLPVAEQTKAVGHAVRAFYMYSGMVDVAMSSGTDSYDNALLALWDDVANTKTYVTGGVGAVASREGFGESYELPNDSAYNETCASIANMMWNERMGRYFDNSKYADEMERALYNGIISCVNLDGDKFFYGNPMQSAGGNSRSAWFGTACCPSNLVRFVESLGSYIYTQKDDQLTLNLYIGNEMHTDVNGSAVALNVNTNMPWDGSTDITYQGDDNAAFTLRLRVPYWATGQNTLTVNGESLSATPDDKGYINVSRTWKKGDKLNISFAMEIQRVYSDERVTTNEGLVAIQRGPIVYTSEAVDNSGSIFDYILDKDAKITAEKIDDITGLSKEYKDVALDPNAPNAQFAGLSSQSLEEAQATWSLFDPYSQIKIGQNAETKKTEISFGKNTRVKAIYNPAEAANWTDYSVEAAITLTNELSANAGVMFRTEGSTVGNDPDDYNGYFAGIGADGGNEGLIIGYANKDKGWRRMEMLSLDKPLDIGRTYKLRVDVRDDLFAVYLDGKFITVQRMDTDKYEKGTVGLRSYNQSFQVSEFTVRPLAEADIPNLQGYYLPTKDTYHVREAVILRAEAEVFQASTWEYLKKTLTMIPYYTWQNRGANAMSVYLQESKELKDYGNIARYATPGASVVSIYDSIAGLNDGSEARWTSYGKSLNPWVELVFPWNVTLNGSVVKWYDDGGGVRIPDGLSIEYWDGEAYVPVTPVGEYNTFKANAFNTYEFETIETTKLRMQIKNDEKNAASGIVEWEVLGDISPLGISLDQENLGLGIGESRLLTAAVNPSASKAPVTWTSDNPEVATVENGLVTAVAAGEATITAETINHKKAYCAIVVVDTSDLEAAVKAAADAAAAAKADALKAQEAAQAAGQAKEQALAQLEEAKLQAKAAKDDAAKAESAKVLAEAQAKAAKADAEAAKAEAQAAKTQADEAKAQSELAKAQVELAKGEATAAKDAAEEAKAAKTLAEAEAKAAKAEAEAAKADAAAAKAEAAAAKAEAAAAKAEAEAAKAEAKAAKEQADAAQKEAAEAYKTYRVTFDSAGGSAITARTVAKGTTVSIPGSPTKRNYRFAGWYEGTKKYDFTSAVTKDLTLTAKWKKVTVGTAQISSAKNSASKKAVITVKKLSGVKGYQFSYTTDKKFKKGIKKVSSKSNKATLKSLKKGKTYYVKVRAFSSDSTQKNVYGKYSKVKKVTIRK